MAAGTVKIPPETVTRHGPRRYSVALSDSVPFGETRELLADSRSLRPPGDSEEMHVAEEGFTRPQWA